MKLSQFFNRLVVSMVFLSAISSNALTVKFGAASTKKISDVTLSEKATLEDSGKSVELTRVADGIREKKIVFVWVKVYVAQLFVADTKGITKANGEAAMESFVKNKPIALSLTFLRNLDSKKIMDAFTESLEANHVKMDSGPFKKLLEEAQKQGDAKEGQTMWFVMNTDSASKDQLAFYSPGKESVNVTADPSTHMPKDFLSIWFGASADSGLEKLKEQLLK